MTDLKGYRMTKLGKLCIMLTVAAAPCLNGCTQQKVKRIGMVVGLKPEKIPEYKALHADSYPGVRDLLNKYHIRNFSIFLHEIEGKYYEFAYYEYTGNDYEADMAALSAEPRNKQWLSVTDPMQIPLTGQKSWAVMEQVYYND